MNSKERRKDRKAKHLINLGREAQVHIARTEHIADTALMAAQLATKVAESNKTGMDAALSECRSLQETIAAANTECARQIEEREKQHLRTLEANDASHHELLERERQKGAEAAKLAEAKIADAQRRQKAAEAALEEPAALRRRLEAKEREIAALNTKLSNVTAELQRERIGTRVFGQGA